jgi:tetratricopeptide (TPR) repeat protein
MLCDQVVFDLQDELNRHAGADWVTRVLPVAVTGRLQPLDLDTGPELGPGGLDCDDAVRALLNGGSLVDLEYFQSEQYAPYIDPMVEQAELASFLRWVRRTYDRMKLQELLTQPNIELIFDADTHELQNAWLEDLRNTSSLIADTDRAELWVESIDPSPLSGNPDLPLDVLKEGIRLYLNGEVASGKRKIHEALQIDPALALGYYTLGWIACREGDWEEAEERLSLAVLLLERPEDIAWCHTMLAPIYLHDARWSLAQGSLTIVENTIESPALRSWADDLLMRVDHILNLRPDPLDRDSPEFDLMRAFMTEWNQAANTDAGLLSFMSALIDPDRAAELNRFYSDIRRNYPSVVFNHAVTAVGRSGSTILVEMLVQAAFPGVATRLPPQLEALRKMEYLRYFQVMPSDEGWKVVDWEDGWFPLETSRHIPSSPIEPAQDQTSSNEQHAD